MRDRLGINKQACRAISVKSCGPNSDNIRSTRHCCSVNPEARSIARIGAMTCSRDRIKAIGKDRLVEGS
jgi:hypothetical protein